MGSPSSWAAGILVLKRTGRRGLHKDDDTSFVPSSRSDLEMEM